MSHFKSLIRCFLLSTSIIFSLSTQAAEGDKRFFVEEVTVKPAKFSEYYQSIPKVIAIMKEHNYRFSTSIVTISDGRFLYFTPVPKYAVMDDMQNQRKEIFKKLTPEQAAIFANNQEITATSRSYFTMLSSTMSYFSAEQNKGKRYFKADTFNFKPGQNAQIEELGMKFIALQDKLGVPKDYYIYKSSIGTEGFQLTLVRMAKDAIDMAQKLKTYNEKYLVNKELQGLRKQLAEMMTSYDSVTGRAPESFRYAPSKHIASM